MQACLWPSCSICSRQLKPSATRIVSGAGGLEWRAAGRRWRWLSRLRICRLKSKRTGHAAASGLDRLDRRTGAAKQSNFAGWPAEDGLVVAMAVEEDVSRLARRAGDPIRGLDGEPVGEEPDLLAQKLWARMSFGNSSSSSSLKTLAQLGSRKMKGRPASICGAMRSRTLARYERAASRKSEVVERATAADVALGHFNFEAGLSKNCFGRSEGLRVVVVVPRIGPQHYLRDLR